MIVLHVFEGSMEGGGRAPISGAPRIDEKRRWYCVSYHHAVSMHSIAELVDKLEQLCRITCCCFPPRLEIEVDTVKAVVHL